MNEVLILPLLLTLAIVAAGLRRVPAQQVSTVHRLGRYRRTLSPGWHWVLPGLDHAGPAVHLIGHHLHVSGAGGAQAAELYYQIIQPEMAGETLDRVDSWVESQAQEALSDLGSSSEQFKSELNRRVGRLGLRVIRCSLHAG